jgi:hypothetical protein
MKTQGEHIRTLRRRVDFLKARDYRNSYDQAELGALEWALVNLPPAQPAPVQPIGEVIGRNEYAGLGQIKHAKTIEWFGEPAPVGTKLYTTPPAQPAVPDAMTSADIQEHIEYVAGWNDCRAEMLEILKARGNT